MELACFSKNCYLKLTAKAIFVQKKKVTDNKVSADAEALARVLLGIIVSCTCGSEFEQCKHEIKEKTNTL